MKTMLKILTGVAAAIMLIRLAQLIIDCLYDHFDRKYIVAEEEDPLYL